MDHAIADTDGLPFSRDLPPAQRATAASALAAQQERSLSAQARRRRAADDAATTAREELRDVVGLGLWTELRELMARERTAVRDLLQPPAGLRRSPAQLNADRRAAVDAFLRKHDVDAARLAAVAASAQARLRAILAPTDLASTQGHFLPAELDTWLELTPWHNADLAWGNAVFDPGDPNDPHRWFVFTPPYFFLPSIGFDPISSENFRVGREWLFDAAAGQVGVIATMDCDDADDIDYASVDTHVDVVMSFTPPVSGVVEVLIDAQNTFCSHDIRTEDEFGWSDSSTGQTNYLSSNVLHPNVVEPSYAEMSTFSVSGNDDDSFHQENLAIGRHYFGHLFSTGSVPAGESVIVTAGTRSFDISGTNDVEIHSRSNFHWFIRSVEVRIAP